MRGDRQFGKENNSTAWCRDYDRQTGITNAMQKVPRQFFLHPPTQRSVLLLMLRPACC
jgi:hypothetical protein